MIKKVVLTFTLLSSSVFADFYELKPVKITDDVRCVIGGINPPMKENNGFVSNMCYINIGDSIVVLDAGPTYNFAKEFYTLIKKDYPKLDVSYVVLSNYHDDRIQGASYFKEMGAFLRIFNKLALSNNTTSNHEKYSVNAHSRKFRS